MVPPAAPVDCLGRLRERDRFEWWRGGADPAGRLREFLVGHGLPAADLGRLTPGGLEHGADGVCGASVFLSAAGAAEVAGAATGRASPAPGVPDLAVVVWEHGPDSGPLRAALPPAPREPWEVGRWRPSWSPAAHAAAVSGARAAIARGDVYQVNVVGHASALFRGDPGPALRAVTALPGARYAGGLTGAGWAVACASPETLVEVTGGRVVTRPIKGTRPATAAGRVALHRSEKERAEHVMIVDLARNDLAQVARTGSVRVPELYAVRRWCDLWQAESTVRAELADGVGLLDLLRAVCPGGSVTGAPKRAALAVIAALEPVGRGPAMGALGWFGPDRLELGLTIRTVAAVDGRLHLWAGGGITWGSDPAAEVAEAAAKAAPIRAALAP